MVKITYFLAGLVASVSGAVVKRGEDTSPATFTQAMQQLQVDEPRCDKHQTLFGVYNNCAYPIHLWRDDSSVDKAAVLSPGARFTEPFRQDWRSGLISYRISTSENGPYSAQGATFLTYNHKRTSKGGSLAAHLYHVFNNQFEDEDIGMVAAGFGRCNVDTSTLSSKDIQLGLYIGCDGKLSESTFLLGVGFCIDNKAFQSHKF